MFVTVTDLTMVGYGTANYLFFLTLSVIARAKPSQLDKIVLPPHLREKPIT